MIIHINIPDCSHLCLFVIQSPPWDPQDAFLCILMRINSTHEKRYLIFFYPPPPSVRAFVVVEEQVANF